MNHAVRKSVCGPYPKIGLPNCCNREGTLDSLILRGGFTLGRKEQYLFLSRRDEKRK